MSHVSVSFHQQHHKPLEGITKTEQIIRIQQIAVEFILQENVEFFCKATEVFILGKSKGGQRISTAEMPNAYVCSANRAEGKTK